MDTCLSCLKGISRFRSSYLYRRSAQQHRKSLRPQFRIPRAVDRMPKKSWPHQAAAFLPDRHNSPHANSDLTGCPQHLIELGAVFPVVSRNPALLSWSPCDLRLSEQSAHFSFRRKLWRSNILEPPNHQSHQTGSPPWTAY